MTFGVKACLYHKHAAGLTNSTRMEKSREIIRILHVLRTFFFFFFPCILSFVFNPQEDFVFFLVTLMTTFFFFFFFSLPQTSRAISQRVRYRNPIFKRADGNGQERGVDNHVS